MKNLWQWVLSLFKTKAEEKYEEVKEKLEDVSLSDIPETVKEVIEEEKAEVVEAVKTAKAKVKEEKAKIKKKVAKVKSDAKEYTEEALNKLSKASIADLASADLSIKLSTNLKKADMIAAFLKAQAEKK